MLRPIRALLSKDLLVTRRDQIATYTLLGGLLVAALARLFVPFLEDIQVTYAVDAKVPVALVSTLELHGRVEHFADRQAVLDRVLQVDDVVGVVGDAGDAGEVDAGTGAGALVIVEGDEDPVILEAPSLVIDEAYAEERGIAAVEIEEHSLGRTQTPLRSLMLALAIYSAIVISGAAIGLTMVDERENDTLTALRVTPARFVHYLLSKLGLISMVVAISAPLAVLIALGGSGRSIDWPAMIAAMLATMPLAWLLGLLLGLLADTQLKAMSALKVLLILFTSLPLLGFADLGGFSWMLAIFAPHWGVQAVYAAVMGGSMMACLWAVLAVLPPLVLVIWLLHRRVGLGAGAVR